MDEKAFLKSYNPKEFDSALVTIDSALFTCHDDQLKVLIVQRENHPFKDKWGLPGGFIDFDKDDSLESAARRKLQEKTSVEPPYIEQLVTEGGPNRDPRGWSVSVCFSALIAHQDCAVHIDSVSDVKWAAIYELNELELAFDHRKIIDIALERLRQKALYSIVPGYALPKTFTFPELQRVHELVIGKEIQKKSFRRRIEQANLLIDTGKKKVSGKRQAALYRMRKHTGDFKFGNNLDR